MPIAARKRNWGMFGILVGAGALLGFGLGFGFGGAGIVGGIIGGLVGAAVGFVSWLTDLF